VLLGEWKVAEGRYMTFIWKELLINAIVGNLECVHKC
jgi:hypothetical protein